MRYVTKDYRAVPCPTGCDRATNLSRLSATSNIPKHLVLASLREDTYPQQLQEAILKIIELVYGQNVGGFYLFHGPNGTGKSHILAAAMNEAMRAGRSAYYTTTLDIINDLRRAAFDKDDRDAETKLMNRVSAVTVLCVDEMGRERNTDYAVEKMFQMLNARYEAAHTKVPGESPRLTIMASNYPPAEMEPYIQSRLMDLNSGSWNLTGIADRRIQQ